jgi:hypothetical protein
MYQWLVYLHIVAGFAFFMAHGASAAMAIRLRQETNLDRLRALLDLSNWMLPVAYAALALLVLAGIAAGILGNWFGRGWIWTALILLVLLWLGMVFYADRYFAPVRQAVGLPYRRLSRDFPAQPPASAAEIAALVQASRPGLLASVSGVIVLVILYLMVFKPF